MLTVQVKAMITLIIIPTLLKPHVGLTLPTSHKAAGSVIILISFQLLELTQLLLSLGLFRQRCFCLKCYTHSLPGCSFSSFRCCFLREISLHIWSNFCCLAHHHSSPLCSVQFLHEKHLYCCLFPCALSVFPTRLEALEAVHSMCSLDTWVITVQFRIFWLCHGGQVICIQWKFYFIFWFFIFSQTGHGDVGQQQWAVLPVSYLIIGVNNHSVGQVRCIRCFFWLTIFSIYYGLLGCNPLPIEFLMLLIVYPNVEN